ncbi:transglycosylase SLT domain-containing protein [Gemmiger sp.]
MMQEAKRRKRRRLSPKAKGLLVSVLIGCIIGGLAGIGHIQSVKKYEAERLEYLKSIPEINYDELREQYNEEPATSEEPTVEPAAYIDPDIPEEVQVAAQEVGKAYDLSPELLEAVAFYESRYRPYSVNGSHMGLMQVSIDWHWDRMERLGVSEAELWRVYPNMIVAGDYLRELFDRYGDAEVVLAIYHGESDARDPHYEPSEYVTGVLEMAEELEAKHEGGEADMRAIK